MKKPHKKCPACEGELNYLGEIPFRAGGSFGLGKFFFSDWTDMDEQAYSIDVFRCNKCGKLEMYDLDFSLPDFDE